MHDSRGATLALRDGERGLVAICHAGCSRADILAELRHLGLIAGPRDYAEGPKPGLTITRRNDNARRIALARRLWEAGQDARGSPVERYLRSRGIDMPVPPCLRWAPACWHPSGHVLPAMLARINSIDGALIGVHRTFLRSDGAGKAVVEPVKAMLGRAAGGAVRLAPATETLMVGEGLETCMSAMQATGMPAWAALSTSGLMALALPPSVQTAIILADNDANGAGERAAYAAAARWLAEGRRVRIATPAGRPETDFNEVLAGCAHGQILETSVVAA